MTGSNSENPGRLDRLLSYLSRDENNLSLLVDTAEAALAEQRPETARQLMARYSALTSLDARALHVASLAALQAGAHKEAAEGFATLLQSTPDDPALRFNRAWSLAMLHDFEEALALLDEDTAKALPQAAMLRIQMI